MPMMPRLLLFSMLLLTACSGMDVPPPTQTKIIRPQIPKQWFKVEPFPPLQHVKTQGEFAALLPKAKYAYDSCTSNLNNIKEFVHDKP